MQKERVNKGVVLVAGGAGFIGSHLCHHLVLEGKNVLCIDNLSTGHMGNISLLMDKPNFRFVHHDVIHPFQYEEENPLRAIYNFACPASPSIIRKIRFTPHRLACWARLTCLLWHRSTNASFCSPLQVRCMAIQMRHTIPSAKTTEATSAATEFALAMTKASAALRVFAWTITDNMEFPSRLSASSIPTAPIWQKMTDVWCPTSSHKR